MRLIDAEALKQMAQEHGFTFFDLQALDNAPTIDAEAVVRCGECKHYHAETGYCNEHSHFIDSEGMSCSPAESPNWTMFGENDFCSYGERKDGTEDG